MVFGGVFSHPSAHVGRTVISPPTILPPNIFAPDIFAPEQLKFRKHKSLNKSVDSRPSGRDTSCAVRNKIELVVRNKKTEGGVCRAKRYAAKRRPSRRAGRIHCSANSSARLTTCIRHSGELPPPLLTDCPKSHVSVGNGGRDPTPAPNADGVRTANVNIAPLAYA